MPEGYIAQAGPEVGKTPDWSLKLIWSLAPGGVSEPETIWSGTLPGGLFRSTDNGDSWDLNRPLLDDPRREAWKGGGADQSGIHSICVDPRDPRHIIPGVSSGGAWITHDIGLSWQSTGRGMRAEFIPPDLQFEPNSQDPHLIAQCPANPDILWVQHHNGIFRSTDRAGSWTEITGVSTSSFGFAVAVHPDNPDTAWFIPAVKDENAIRQTWRSL